MAGFVVRELSPIASNWRARDPLDAYLANHGIAVIEGVDTRAVTRHIRSAGAMRGAVAPAELERDELLSQIHAQPAMTGLDLTKVVTPKEPYPVPAQRGKSAMTHQGEDRYSRVQYRPRAKPATVSRSTTSG